LLKQKTKTIVLFKHYSKQKRDEVLNEYKRDFPQFEIYKDFRQNRNSYNVTYQIKAQGPIEEIEKYLKAEKTKENAPIQTIIDLLKNEMEPLRIMFHEKTQEWANNDYDRIEKVANMNSKDFFEAHKCYIKYTEREIQRFERFGWKKGNEEIQDKVGHWVADYGYWHGCKEVYKLGREDFLKKAENNAEMHYQNSIIKLAGRIDKKGLNIDKLKAETKYSKIDVNIETILSDGKKSVIAWTIIASGPIQRPHYRYLVK